MQPAYKSGHSTATALVKVKADLLHVTDQQEVVCPVLLHLSLEFDTTDHFLLLQRLEDHFGIKETALEWIRLYLTGRTLKVSVGSSRSPPVTVMFGVPQGSILGQFCLLYIPVHWAPSARTITSSATCTQMINKYMSFKPGKTRDKVKCM